MTAVLLGAGLVLVVVALVEIALTTVSAASGGGPLTGWMSGRMWVAALGLHRRRPSHALLSYAGVAVTLAVIAQWILLVVAGWALVFGASEGAVRVTATQEPADLVGRLYFSGYTVFTLGNGDYVPGAGLWQLAAVAAVGTGLFIVTLSVTYLVPVAAAVSLRRQLGNYIASLGATPDEIVVRGWSRGSFASLGPHLVALTAMVHTSRQQHLNYPVLHFFHSRHEEDAVAPNIVHLSQALHLLRHGVAPHVRLDRLEIEPLDRAIGGFLATLRAAHLEPRDPVALPTRAALQAAAVPLVDEEEYLASARPSHERRVLLGALLDDDGWTLDPGRG